MAACVVLGPGGELVLQVPAPADLSTCSMVVPSGPEVIGNPLALSAADGGAIAGAVVLVWGAGFVGRALIRALSLGESPDVQD